MEEVQIDVATKLTELMEYMTESVNTKQARIASSEDILDQIRLYEHELVLGNLPDDRVPEGGRVNPRVYKRDHFRENTNEATFNFIDIVNKLEGAMETSNRYNTKAAIADQGVVDLLTEAAIRYQAYLASQES